MDKIKDTSLTLLQTLVNATGAEFEDEKLAVDIIAKTITEVVKNNAVLPLVVGRSEQLICSCGSKLVKTTGGYHCGNAKCNI